MLPTEVQALIDVAIAAKTTAISDKVEAVNAAAVTVAAQKDQSDKEGKSAKSLSDAKTAADAAVAGLAAFLAPDDGAPVSPANALAALRASLKMK